MTQKPDMSEMDDYYERTRRPLFKTPTTLLGRLGCGALIAVWFVVLLAPCAMVWLALGNTLTIPRGNVPEPELHPVLEVQLVMEIDNRGLKFTSTNINQVDDRNLCIENSIDYFLWESDSSATPATYCQCYERENTDSVWEFIQQIEASCTP